jgi:predicted nucleotidyltransferase
LWSTGQGVVFNKFELSDYSLKVLDILIDLVRNDDIYSPDVKKIIIKEMMSNYLPKKLI